MKEVINLCRKGLRLDAIEDVEKLSIVLKKVLRQELEDGNKVAEIFLDDLKYVEAGSVPAYHKIFKKILDIIKSV